MLFLPKVFQEMCQDDNLIGSFLHENASFMEGQGYCKSEYINGLYIDNILRKGDSWMEI